VKILTVPNWSFGRDNGLLRLCRDYLETQAVEIHYVEGDVDHNRTVTGFSGEANAVGEALIGLADLILPSVDLNRHIGCHPRIGALDVCPFVPYDSLDGPALNAWIDGFAPQFSERFSLPIFLYERSEKGRHSGALPALRKAGFGGLLASELDTDFGPRRAHPEWGATVMGWRDFLVAVNLNLKEERAVVASNLAARIRSRRRDGDLQFKGVRALGFMLPSRGQSQLSLNLTQPNETYVDQVMQWGFDAARVLGIEVADTELIGVIRVRDMEHAMLLEPKREQIVEMR
jgi:glutamate formiminotransferase